MEKLAIIGNGPAGLTAAVYAARADLKPAVLTGPQPGGQLTITSEVENFPGFPEGITGPELISKMQKQAEKFGAEIKSETVESMSETEGGYSIKTESGEFTSKAVILATGSSAMSLGLESEKRMLGRGVSMCATCDGFFTRGKKVAVVGGGDTAIEEATFLAKFASEVKIIHRRDEFRASKAMQHRISKNEKISTIMDSVVSEVLGEDKVEALKIKNVKTGAENEEKFDFLFVAIGHKPNSGFTSGLAELDDKGYVKINPPSTSTGKPGLFACGDLTDPIYRQAVSAAGSGCIAALDAERYLAE